MVDHIHFPKRVGPLFPTERIKKVRRRKDQQQDSGFKDDLEKEKTDDEGLEEDDSYAPGPERKLPAVLKPKKAADSTGQPAEEKPKQAADEVDPEKRIDVHA